MALARCRISKLRVLLTGRTRWLRRLPARQLFNPPERIPEEALAYLRRQAAARSNPAGQLPVMTTLQLGRCYPEALIRGLACACRPSCLPPVPAVHVPVIHKKILSLSYSLAARALPQLFRWQAGVQAPAGAHGAAGALRPAAAPAATRGRQEGARFRSR